MDTGIMLIVITIVAMILIICGIITVLVEVKSGLKELLSLKAVDRCCKVKNTEKKK